MIKFLPGVNNYKRLRNLSNAADYLAELLTGRKEINCLLIPLSFKPFVFSKAAHHKASIILGLDESFRLALNSNPTDFMLIKSPHILVVDDNEEILSTISIILSRKAYQVSAKGRIENFEQTVEDLSPDLILLDKNLGWADGCDLCKSIKSNKKLSSIPVIMFSAYYKKRDECIEAGADEFIEKPFEMHALLNTIQSFAGSRKPA